MNIWASRVLLPLLDVDDSTSRHKPGPRCFYPESRSGQLKVGASRVDAVGRQANCLIENMAFLVVFFLKLFVFSILFGYLQLDTFLKSSFN